MWAGQAPPQQQQQQQQQQQKHDIFVGNLAFNTTEEQLHQVFSEVGRVLKVRMVTDTETGKPRGFAFVEYHDPQAALSAIRNMNDYELNGRRIRVNFSNSSHLETLAGTLGMEMPTQNQTQQQTPAAGSGTLAVTEALKGMSKGEIYDIVEKLKEIADRDPEEARRILSGHPQLPEAILFCMSKLDMVQTPIAVAAPVIPQHPPTAAAAAGGLSGAVALPVRADPRAAAAAAAAAAASDPRQRVADPRSLDPRMASDPRTRDPRRAAQQQQQQQQPPPPPPPPAVSYSSAPPPPPPPPQQQQQQQQQGSSTSVAHNLDPALVQQVMSLTPQQIAALPPDKATSIMALRNQITGGR